MQKGAEFIRTEQTSKREDNKEMFESEYELI